MKEKKKKKKELAQVWWMMKLEQELMVVQWPTERFTTKQSHSTDEDD